jgi:hypothetical protein
MLYIKAKALGYDLGRDRERHFEDSEQFARSNVDVECVTRRFAEEYRRSIRDRERGASVRLAGCGIHSDFNVLDHRVHGLTSCTDFVVLAPNFEVLLFNQY